MASDAVVHTNERDGPFANPWPFMLTGLGTTILALLVFAVTYWLADEETASQPVLLSIRLVLVGAGLLATGGAVVIRPKSAAILGLAAVVALAASWGLNQEWDTVHLALGFGALVATLGAILVLLPPMLGRVVVSLLILVHFGGILVAVTSVPPPKRPPPWLTGQLWGRFYRPYLQFMYLNNAYHFYSPEPGPATLLWCRVEYADGSSRWIKMPNRYEHAKDPLAQEFYRRLSITESINQLLPPLPGVPEEIVWQRRLAGNAKNIVLYPEKQMDLTQQFRIPVDHVRKLLGSYVRFVARSYPHDKDSKVAVKGVKVYRVIHSMVQPGPFSTGQDPLDPTMFYPFFQGEFDAQGNIKDPKDPFLYWLIPIVRVAKGKGNVSFTDAALDYDVLDCLAIHAGSKHWGDEE